MGARTLPSKPHTLAEHVYTRVQVLRAWERARCLVSHTRLLSTCTRACRCCVHGQFEQAVGVALEARRLDKLEEVIQRSTDSLKTLKYALRCCQGLIINRDFRQQVRAGRAPGPFIVARDCHSTRCRDMAAMSSSGREGLRQLLPSGRYCAWVRGPGSWMRALDACPGCMSWDYLLRCMSWMHALGPPRLQQLWRAARL